MNTTTVAVVGPGAIGTTVAAALHEDGRTPLLAGRTPREHLELADAAGRVVVPGPVRTDPEAVAGPVDVVLLAVKGTQTAAAAPWLAALCGPDTVVAVLQNGVEQVRTVSPSAHGAAVVPSVVWFPAETRPDGSVLLRATPRLTLPDGPAGATVAGVFAGTRVEVDLSADFTTVAWRKLVQNAVAGLMALTGRRAGVFTRQDLGQLARDYAAECVLVARAAGARLDDDVPDTVVSGFRGSPADAGTSILADRVAGRPLEWEERNGVVRRVGHEHGVPTPISDVVVPLLAAASDGPG
ncbi:oxidoreductase [Curtobacterium sp. 9128]|uniref:oxidoreductase n=1 Tax=Curtobacterium sp. 9128 TaxID=1793722 RepID=UPI0021B282AF|nr:oxidoreductase [Curtobacterium sp. 9128]